MLNTMHKSYIVGSRQSRGYLAKLTSCTPVVCSSLSRSCHRVLTVPGSVFYNEEFLHNLYNHHR